MPTQGANKARCYYCGIQLIKPQGPNDHRPNVASRDHKIPRSRGGIGVLNNKVWACYKCNQEKGILTVGEFRAVIFYRNTQVFSKKPKRPFLSTVLLPEPYTIFHAAAVFVIGFVLCILPRVHQKFFL